MVTNFSLILYQPILKLAAMRCAFIHAFKHFQLAVKNDMFDNKTKNLNFYRNFEINSTCFKYLLSVGTLL